MRISLVLVVLGIVLLVIPTGKTMDHYDGLGFVFDVASWSNLIPNSAQYIA